MYVSVAGLFLVEGAVLLGVPVPVTVQQNLLTVFLLIISCWSAARTPSAQRETAMTSSDAATMPLFAGSALVALYAAFRFLDPVWVNFVLKAYFVLSGAIAVSFCAAPVARAALPRARPLFSLALWSLPSLPTWLGGPATAPPSSKPWEPTAADALALAVGSAVAGWYAAGGGWLANNVLGFSFCVGAIGVLNPGSFTTAALLQSALFVYDIVAVFGTGAVLGPNRVSIMEEVAVRLDGPIKIFFPSPDGNRRMALLGLGDIIVPGSLLALLLRFDAVQALARGGVDGAVFNAVYFNAGVLAYVGGLALTSLALALMDTAQPALLYLVPCLLFTTLTLAVARGELGKLWKYDEEAAAAEGTSSVTVGGAGAVAAGETKKDQ